MARDILLHALELAFQAGVTQSRRSQFFGIVSLKHVSLCNKKFHKILFRFNIAYFVNYFQYYN